MAPREDSNDSLSHINLSIKLDTHSNVFYTSDVLRGVVQLFVQEQIFIEELAVEFIGTSEISWHDKDLSKGRTDLNIYYHRKQIAKEHHEQRNLAFRRIPLVVNSEVYTDKHIYEKPFQTKISNQCVSSCDFEFGYVRYELKVMCKTSHGTKEYKQALRIIQLSSDFIERPLYDITSSKGFKLQTRLENSCFQPGDKIQIQVQICIPDSNKTYRFVAQLKQYITYNHHSSKHHKYGMVHDFDEHLNQMYILHSEETSVPEKYSEQDIRSVFQLPANITTTTHITMNRILNVHYEINLLVLEHNGDVCLCQKIPIDILAWPKQLDAVVSKDNTLRTEKARTQEECCVIYKKKRHSLMKALDKVLKY
ncbi:uncharacterized protein [Musca autumnalis]|uniref:uncharacterized protein n=1 Tax=Musca autumnalis TaxID=221902 RepID=UPI003CE73E66